MKALRSLIRGPRLLRPRLLRAFFQVSAAPLKDYWNILNEDCTLHLTFTSGHSTPVRFQSFAPLIHLLELHLFGIRPVGYDATRNLLIFDLYGDRFYLRPAGYSLGGILEIFRDKAYGDSFEGAYVLDIGAFTGDSAIYFARGRARKVIAVEPSPTILEILRQNVEASRYKDKIEVLPVAISDYDGSSTLLVDERYAGGHYLSDFDKSSYYSDVFYFDSPSSVPVDVWSFKHLLDYTGEEEIDVAKFDCKGAEYAVLLNTDPKTLRRVKRYIIAYHAGAERLIERLRQIGYEKIVTREPKYNKVRPVVGIIFAERRD